MRLTEQTHTYGYEICITSNCLLLGFYVTQQLKKSFLPSPTVHCARSPTLKTLKQLCTTQHLDCCVFQKKKVLRIKGTGKRFIRRGRYEGLPPPIPSYPLLSLHLLWLTDNIPSITTVSSTHLVGRVRVAANDAAMMELPSGREGVAANFSISRGCHQNPVLTQWHELRLGEGGRMGMKCICSIIYAGVSPPPKESFQQLNSQYNT